MNTALDPSAVLDALIRACSQDAQVLKPAEHQLKSWESQPGFYSILASLFLKHDMDANVRWLAVLCFKNGVDRYWRRDARSTISEEEKSSLRSQLIASFDEPIIQIATQLSVLIGKIARLDCPLYWPELIPVLLDAVRVNDFLRQHRAMLVFYHVVSSLASRRCEEEIKTFEELTSDIFVFMFSMWETNNNSFFSAIQSRDCFAAEVAVDRILLVLKVLRQLMTYGFSKLEKNASAMDFMRLVPQRIHHFVKAKPLLESLSQDLLPKREKVIVILSKMLNEVQDKHAEAFVEFLQPSLEMAVLYSFTNQGNGLIFERFTVLNLNLIQSILISDTYRPAKAIEETKNPIMLIAHKIKTEFFTDEVLVTLCRHLVLHYFILTQEDLTCWESDPESFMSEEYSDSYRLSIRLCTDSLFRILVKEFSRPLLPLLVKMLNENKNSIDPNDLNAVLKKDAVYCALGKVSYDLYEFVNFDKFFLGNLLPELQIRHLNYHIIQRRIIWLIGCWVGVKLSVSLRPKLYESVIPFLDQSQDLVVRIQAAFTLRLSMDNFEFNTQEFIPYLDVCFGKLILLLKDVSECETKMTILNVISFIIERMQIDIRPHVALLIQYLPMLWDASAEHNMLRWAILTTLTRLVQVLGNLCLNMFDLLLPVIRLSTDVTQPPHIYLYEDGLELWSNTIQCCPCATPQLLDLFSNMGPLIEMGTESLQVCLKIIDAYIVLAPTEFFQQYYSSLATSLTSLLKHVNAEATVLIYEVIERIVTVFPEDGPAVFSSVLSDVFQSISEIEQIESPSMTMMQLVLFSRVILHCPQFFWSFVKKLAKQSDRTNSEVVQIFYDNVSRKMSFVPPDKKNLCALALLSLLNNNSTMCKEKSEPRVDENARSKSEAEKDNGALAPEQPCEDERPSVSKEIRRAKHIIYHLIPKSVVNLKQTIDCHSKTTEMLTDMSTVVSGPEPSKRGLKAEIHNLLRSTQALLLHEQQQIISTPASHKVSADTRRQLLKVAVQLEKSNVHGLLEDPSRYEENKNALDTITLSLFQPLFKTHQMETGLHNDSKCSSPLQTIELVPMVAIQMREISAYIPELDNWFSLVHQPNEDDITFTGFRILSQLRAMSFGKINKYEEFVDQRSSQVLRALRKQPSPNRLDELKRFDVMMAIIWSHHAFNLAEACGDLFNFIIKNISLLESTKSADDIIHYFRHC